jgi:hypothetical protein
MARNSSTPDWGPEVWGRPKFLMPKLDIWRSLAIGDPGILEYRKRKMIHIATFLAVGNGLEMPDIIRAQFDAAE